LELPLFVNSMGLQTSVSRSRRWMLGQLLLGIWLVAVVTFALAFSFERYTLNLEDVAPQDIRAPRDLTYISDLLSRQAAEDAMANVVPIYTRADSDIARQQIARARQLLDFISAVRADTYATPNEKQTWVLAVLELNGLPLPEVNSLLGLPDASWQRVQIETIQLLDTVMRQEEIRAEVLGDARSRIPALVPMALAQDEAQAVANLVQGLLKPNSFYDEEATALARQQAAQTMGTVFKTLRNGEIIVREGSVVTPLDLEALNELGLNRQDRDQRDWVLALVVATVSVLLLGLGLLRLQPALFNDLTLQVLLVVLLTFFALLARVLIPSGTLLPYLFPGAALAMLAAATVGYPAAVAAVLLLGLLCGWIGGLSLQIAAVVTFSSLVALLTLPRYEQVGAIFRSGLLAGLTALLTAYGFSAVGLRNQPLQFMLVLGVSFGGGVLSSALTLSGLFLLAPLFDLTTTFRLLELSRPNHPLLQRLLREAPATFHHTMMIASMSEQAAERIGANGLLTRVGAYYHDVGKLARPYFFVENQEGLSNPHDRLDPHTSADIVVGHVRDGVKVARQYGLPVKVRAFITEHQGTMQVSFFYRKALDLAGGEAGLVDEAQFRYPGPRPQSKETALVMLGDGCEAATRARRPTTPEDVIGAVDYIFDSRIKDGQLAECPITLQELRVVRDTYIEILRGAFHPRIQYPPAPEKSQVASDKPQAEGEEHQVASDRPQAEGEEPQVASDKPQAEGEKPQVASDKPQTEGEKPQAASDKPV